MKIFVICLYMVFTMFLSADVFDKLPTGCFVISRIPINKIQIDNIGTRLGYPLNDLSNTVISIHGKRVQVNIIETVSKSDAMKLHRTLLLGKGNPAFCILKDNKVIEFVGPNLSIGVVKKTAFEFGFIDKPKLLTYQLDVSVVPIDRANYMDLNPLFNLLLRNENDANRSEISKYLSKVKFGKTLYLRNHPYSFVAKNTKSQVNDIASFRFDDMSQEGGIPYVKFSAKIRCNDKGITRSLRKVSKKLLCSTKFWPVSNAKIKSLAKSIVKGKRSQKEKVDAILEWLQPGKNIKYAGQMGSRYGVMNVLSQKFGQCWDFSDCFITLARAAKIPCRQVAGWFYGVSGHVWAEVLIPGKGWQQVDPTGGGKVKCGVFHISYFVTENGEMPILYSSLPKIEIIK